MCQICVDQGIKSGGPDCIEEAGNATAKDGINSETGRLPGSDTVPEDTSTSETLAIGSSVVGYINSSTDEDWYEVQLVAGQTYEFTLTGTTTGGETALGDAFLSIRNDLGVIIEFDDDAGVGVNSVITFTAEITGSYFLEADAYDTETGQYTLTAASIATPTPSGNPLTAIDWGTTVTPTAGVIDVYFALNGEVFDSQTSQGWSAYEVQQAMAAFGVFQDVIDVTFNQVFSAAAADFKLVATTGLDALGYFNPQGETNEGVGVFDTGERGWNTTGGLEQGGYGFITLIHEIGHGMGLAHPHDNGGTSNVLPGITTPNPGSGVGVGDLGDFNLNQGIFTTMSYNDGWLTAPAGQSPNDTYGWQGSMMALDIASLQADYGANNSFNTGNNVYVLPTSNAAGTFYQSLWDAGGIDTIQHNGSTDATIDLREATLLFEFGGGGFVSHATGIHGGFTIADNVAIENATGGSGSDVLTGNDLANTLRGNGGSDQLTAGAGNDLLFVDADDTVTDGGAGYDRLFAEAGSGALNVNLGASGLEFAAGGNFEDTFDASTVGEAVKLFGFGRDDTLTGSAFADFIDGGAGNDSLVGNAGADILDGSTGADRFDGGAGADTLFIDSNDTVVDGGADSDQAIVRGYSAGVTLDVTAGNLEKVNGNTQNDTFDATAATFAVKLFGQGGDDSLTGGDVADQLYGSVGNDTLNGNGGADILNAGTGADQTSGGAGNDIIFIDADDTFVDGGADFDRVYVSSGSAGVTLDLTAANVEFASGQAGGDTFNGAGSLVAVKLKGEGGNDTLTGGDVADQIFGGAGADLLTGNGGGDILNAGANDDTILGGAGVDIILGGLGNDSITGGTGDDRLYGEGGTDTFFFTNTGWGDDKIYGFEDGTEVMDMTATGLSAANLNVAVVGGNTLVTFDGITDSITFIGINSGIDAGDFNF